MFKTSNKSYTDRFLSHFVGFIREYGLINNNDQLLVALSGGLDSMTLLHVLCELERFGYSLKLRAVHVNHGTREENEYEANMVREYCKVLKVKCIESKLSGLKDDGNFEHLAREKRYVAMYEKLLPGEKLVLAHHIDDSFEWSVLQMFRSSNLKSALGIPLKREDLIRPFMCVSKEQIKKYLEAFDLPFLEDPTNEQNRYERNYIRNQISESFAPRYKNYLHHYVNRQNEQARALGLHLLNSSIAAFKMRYLRNEVHIYTLKNKIDTSGLENSLLKGVNYLAPGGRSSLGREINKVVAAFKKGKRGPMRLGPDVFVYMSYQYILMITLDAYKNVPIFKSDLKSFEYFTLNQFEEYLETVLEQEDLKQLFPLYVEIEKRVFNFEGGKIFDFHQLSLNKIDKRRIIPAIKLLKYWRQERNQTDVLSLRFLFSV